eukprot:TRINITY_DN6201_c0_g1_i1.p1 TRINITY_DN6201_c0_g1~~TRINITY_DN6201_c0_g1_i1.p1  ORF type:complete len:262 (+),score=55.27 TRINITY_DN6201_c0_g1_i1:94-879(+)
MDNEFANYEKELELQVRNTNQKLIAVRSLTGVKRTQVFRELDEAQDNAKEILGNMKDASRSNKGKYDAKIRNYERDIEKYAVDIQQAKQGSAGFVRTKQENVSYREDLEAREYQQKNQLLKDTETLQESRERLYQIGRLAHETTETGEDTLIELKKQREQLNNASSQLDGINDNVKRGRSILSAMSRRVVTNKIILLFIILCLIAANIAVIYVRWIRPLTEHTPTTPHPTIAPSLPPTLPPTLSPTLAPTTQIPSTDVPSV